MSRHRNVRNMTFDDYNDGYSDDEADEYYSEDEDEAGLNDLVLRVKNITGLTFSDSLIKQTLTENNLNLETTVDCLFSSSSGMPIKSNELFAPSHPLSSLSLSNFGDVGDIFLTTDAIKEPKFSLSSLSSPKAFDLNNLQSSNILNIAPLTSFDLSNFSHDNAFKDSPMRPAPDIAFDVFQGLFNGLSESSDDDDDPMTALPSSFAQLVHCESFSLIKKNTLKTSRIRIIDVNIDRGPMFVANLTPDGSFKMIKMTGGNSAIIEKYTNALSLGDNEAFNFDTPSPDEIANAARSKDPLATKQSTLAKRASIEAATKAMSLSATSIAPPTMTRVGSQGRVSQQDIPLSRSGSSNSIRKISSFAQPVPLSRSSSSNSNRISSTQKLTTAFAVQNSPRPNKKLINVAEEYAKQSSIPGHKPSLNLVVVGHVDSGKSTTMGHLLLLLGEVNERMMKKYQKQSEDAKKKSFHFAWVLDETDEERSRGVTIDVAVNKFETASKRFTLLDAPGHKDFIPNMISGASQADAAILVIDATTGEFESSFEQGGQTREHALLLRSLGVSQLIVGVNKLDMVQWAEYRFMEICEKLKIFLISEAGFNKSKIWYIPMSGFTGENLVSRNEALLSRWYSGNTLVQQIDLFQVPLRPIDRKFRMSVIDFFKGGLGAGGGGAVSVRGRIEAGSIQIGECVMIRPVNVIGIIKAIECKEDSPKWAIAGDTVLMSLTNCDESHFTSGCVLCDPEAIIPVTAHFRAQIVTFDLDKPLVGDDLVLIQGSLKEECRISKMISLLDKSTGEVIKKNPRMLTKHVTAVVEIRIKTRAICMETFKDNKELGRFMLRKQSNTVGAGIVLEILSFEQGG